MKLLTKNQIAVDTSLSRKRNIDEGVFIAKKIDALREDLSTLQKQRLDFIIGTKQELENETKSLHQIVYDLKMEVEEIEINRNKLKEPLDKEWELLKEDKFNLEAEQNLFKQHKAKLDDREFYVSAKEVEVEDKNRRVDLIQGEFERILKESQDEKILVDSILSETKGKAEVMNKMIESRLDEVIERENRVKFNLQGIEQKEKNNDEREKELNDRDRQINDKYNTLQETMKRLTK